MSSVDKVLGLTKDEAVQSLQERGFKVRVINVDGPPAVMTENVDLGRVTIEIKDNKVVWVYNG